MEPDTTQIDDLTRELKKRLEGEVRFDRYTRLLYATDASIYEIEPIGVVLPRHKGDVQAAIEVANRYQVPILPRGGGTSLAGQAVGKAIILDHSKYMNRILEVERQEGWCRLQPGVIQDELNLHLHPLGLLFGPDTSTSNRATLGGMIGNNSAGAHSIAYGKTVDHVLELTVLLADGSEVKFKDLTPNEVEAKVRRAGLEGVIYREVCRLAETHREEIQARYPKIMRRVSGYNLDEVIKPHPLNLARLITGSEGTLAVVVEAKVRLVPRPPHTALDVIHFLDSQEALEATQPILETDPYALELVDKMTLDLARGNLEQAKRMHFLQGDPAGILLVEYAGESEGEVRDKMGALQRLLRRQHIGYASVQTYAREDQANIWKVRKAGLGLLLGMKGEKRPLAFVEDTAVAPEKLPAFIKRFRAILEHHEVTAGYYGHCSVGCLHIRPFINLKEATGIARMVAIAEEITDLVIEYGGSISGEHGDGLARSHWNEKLFGPRLYEAFCQVKRAFDPKGLMNPGKIVNAPPMTQDLRYSPAYKTWEPQTILDFSREGGFAAAVEFCNGMGVCRKKLEGTMCPSYMVTLDEEHSTRGRANALRAALSGKVPAADFTGRRLYEVLDLCLECKGCKAECPSNVDLAKLKYEFLAHYYQANGLPWRNRLFGHIAQINAWGTRLAPLANRLMNHPLARYVLERVAGIDHRRPLPPFACQTFEHWFHSRQPQGDGRRGKVILFHDTFVTYNHPQIGQAAVQFLEACGYRVSLPRKRCCGRPLISKGMLRQAKEMAAWNVGHLFPHAQEGLSIIGLEPSCLLTLRDEYPDLLRTDKARVVARQSLLLEEFLLQEREAGKLDLPFPASRDGAAKDVLLHGHCHQKALVGTTPTVSVLRWAGYRVEEVDAGCCGMAGSFGFEREHYDLSVAIGQRRLIPAVKAAAPQVEVVAPGVSCRQQIEHLAGRQAKHPAELLWEALKPQR